MVGWVRLRGPLQVRPCKLGRRLLVCAVLRTRQDRGWASCPTRPRHASGPCGSRPRHRTHPAFDSSPRSVGMHGLLLVGVEPGRHVDPRHAWMLFVQLSKYSISMEIHPRMAWIYLRHRKSVGDGVVWVGRTVGAMDGAIEPPWMGLRRVLPTHTAPANKQNSQSRLLPLPLQVQGRRPCRTNPNPRPGNPRSASAHRSARDAACPSASAAPATAHPPAYPAAGPAGCAPGSAGPAAGR